MFCSHFCLYAGLLTLLATASGCGKTEPTSVPVHGHVKLDGRPLANASVVFITQNQGGRNATGVTNANGVFHLSTSKNDDGAFPGKYKVIVQQVAFMDPGAVAKSLMEGASPPPRRPSANLPPRYSDLAQTVLVQDIPASGDVIFELQSK